MKRWKVLRTALALVAISSLAHADDGVGNYGGYYSNEETRFKGYVWDFIEELGKDCDGFLGACTDFVSSWINDEYSRKQYVQGSCAQLLDKSLTNIDSVDLAYVAGHGNKSLINMSGTSCDLTRASWGDFSSRGKGDLESVVFHSCKVLEMDSGWRSRWMRSSATQARPFSGLHHAMGFRTNHVNGLGAGAWTSDEMAENLEEDMSVRLAWYEAVEDGYWLSPYAVVVNGDNKQAIFYIPANGNETMTQLKSGGAGDFNFGSSSYSLTAYYNN